jgi:hypothetical protein
VKVLLRGRKCGSLVLLWERNYWRGCTLGEELLKRFYSGRGTVEEVLLWERHC